MTRRIPPREADEAHHEDARPEGEGSMERAGDTKIGHSYDAHVMLCGACVNLSGLSFFG